MREEGERMLDEMDGIQSVNYLIASKVRTLPKLPIILPSLPFAFLLQPFKHPLSSP